MNKWLKAMLIACISVWFPVNNLNAQENWEDLFERLMTHDDENSSQWENLLEDLTDLKEHPININSATKEQLEKFPFLSASLIENILYYLYKNGPMLSDKELLMVQDMDIQTVRYLKPFITFEQVDKEKDRPTLKTVFKHGKQEFSTRLDVPFYIRKGYQTITSEELQKNPNQRYLGYAFYHNIRYSANLQHIFLQSRDVLRPQSQCHAAQTKSQNDIVLLHCFFYL